MNEVKCELCGEIINPEYATSVYGEPYLRTEGLKCKECLELSDCCGAEITNGFCTDCKEHA